MATYKRSQQASATYDTSKSSKNQIAS